MRLEDKRVMVTQSDDYMGPAITSLFSTEGASDNPGKTCSDW